jgi:hypothetical protein
VYFDWSIAILIWIVCGIATFLIAQNRGATNAPTWFLVGVLLGPIGILLAAVGAKGPTQVAPPQPPPAAASGWTPTHRVPDEGMAAWAAADPSLPVSVTLAGRLEVVVAERADDWARVVAVNGWTGWVDARRLVPRS